MENNNVYMNIQRIAIPMEDSLPSNPLKTHLRYLPRMYIWNQMTLKIEYLKN